MRLLRALAGLSWFLVACGGGTDPSGSRGPAEAEDVTSGAETGGPDRPAGASAQAELAATLALPAGPEGTVVCALAGGAIRWLLPVPEGFASLSIEGRCHLTTEDERSTVMVDAVAVGDAGAEQQLGIEPDGVRRWIAAGFAPDAQPVAEGTIRVAGETTHWYRLHDTVGDPAVPIEMMAMRRTIGAHHVLVVVFLKEGASWTWDAAEAWVRGIRRAP